MTQRVNPADVKKPGLFARMKSRVAGAFHRRDEETPVAQLDARRRFRTLSGKRLAPGTSIREEFARIGEQRRIAREKAKAAKTAPPKRTGAYYQRMADVPQSVPVLLVGRPASMRFVRPGRGWAKPSLSTRPKTAWKAEVPS